MASIQLDATNFAPGTNLSVYPWEGWRPGSPPSGTALDTATVAADSTVTFDGLTAGARYVAWSGSRGVAFRVDETISDDLVGPPAGLADRVAELEQLASAVETNIGAVAAGTGVAALDMATLTAALATAGPKRLTRGSTYLVNAALLLLSDTDLDLNGATVQVAAGTTMNGGVFQATNRENAHVRDGVIDLNKANTTDPGADTAGMAVSFAATSSTGIKNCSARRLTIKDGHRVGISSSNTDASTNPSEVTIEDCKITGCVKRGIYATRPTDLIARNNRLSGNCTDDLGGGQIQVTNGGADAGALIEGNRCVSAGDNAHGIAASFAENIQIIGNRCHLNGGAGTNGWGIAISEGVDNFEVIGNRCKGNRIGGITVDVRVGATTDIRACNGVVSDNVCSGAAVSHGIYHQFGTGLTISNNVCHGNAHSGILVADAQRTQVYGNTCHSNTLNGIAFTQSVISTAGDHWLGPNHVYSNTAANYVGLAHAALGNPVGRFDQDDGQAGILVPTKPTWTTHTLVASRGVVIRFVPSRTMKVGSIAFAVVTAAGADDAVDVGIYDSAFARLVSSGATLGQLNSLGVKNIDITDTVLNAGEVYYAALSAGTFGGSAAAVVGHNFVQDRAPQLFGTAAGLVLNGFDATGHPLDPTFVSAGAVAINPVLALREA